MQSVEAVQTLSAKAGKPMVELPLLHSPAVAATTTGPLSTPCPCGNPARPGQRTCWDCHAKNMREWRQTNRPSPEQRRKANCRRYTNTYIERGLLIPEPCIFCGVPQVEPHHLDYSQPLNIAWLCHFHHLAIHGKTVRKYHVEHS